MEQKLNLEFFCNEDRHLKGNGLKLNPAIYYDSGHRAYQNRWDAAATLRNASRQLPARDREETWGPLMTGFVFDSINQQSSE